MPANRDEKFRRMNQVREAVEKQPRSFTELMALVYGSKPPSAANRTLQYDLEGLRILGLINLDSGQYHSTEVKQVYQTDAEYRAALKHSQKMMFTNKTYQGFNDIAPEVVADVLANVLNDPNHYNKEETGIINLFFQHLKTGYYEDIYAPILRFQEIGSKYPRIRQAKGFSKMQWGLDDLRELDYSEDEVVRMDFEALPENLDCGIEDLWGTRKNGEVTTGVRAVVYKEVIENPEVVKEYTELKYEIASKINGLLALVENGSPLAGYCDACPTRHIKILS